MSHTHVGPLNGIRVLDLTRLLPGPFCTQLLCDLGAEVIKVEDADGGDYSRFMSAIAGDPLPDGNSPAFHALNRGKKSIILNFKHESDRQTFRQLIPTAHVLSESFRPGVLHKLGFSPTQLHTLHPSLVICSISGYGQTGPDTLRAGHDINYLAKAGVLGMMRNPTVLPVQVADICGGAFPAAIQILAALRQAEKTGKGSYIDVSMTDCSYALLQMSHASYAWTGKSIGGGQDTLVGAYPCYDVYRTKDGHITVGALEPKFWIPFVKHLNLDITQQQYATGEEGIHVRQVLQDKLLTKTNAEWEMDLKHVDGAVEIVHPPEGIADQDPQLVSRQLTLDLTIGDKQLRVPKMPIRMTDVECVNQPAPGYGQHTDEIRASLSSIPSKL